LYWNGVAVDPPKLPTPSSSGEQSAEEAENFTLSPVFRTGKMGYCHQLFCATS
jgi:hypothetical protein